MKNLRKNKSSILFNIIIDYFKRNKESIILLLFSAYPLLSLYSVNIEELDSSGYMIMPMLIVVISFSFCVIITINFIFKNRIKSQIIIYTLFLLFFTYGHVRDLFSLRHRYLIVVYIILFISILYFTLRTRKDLKLVSNLINTSCFFLIGLVLFNLFSFKINKAFKNDIVYEQEDLLISLNSTHPDIYYFILDGYANSKVLNEFFNFDNKIHEKFLVNKGFYVTDESRCNYMSTFLSLNSTLNMRYLDTYNSLSNQSKKSIISKSTKNNAVAKYLKKKGYKTINIDGGLGPLSHNINYDYNLALEEFSFFGEFNVAFLHTTPLQIFIGYLIDTHHKKSVLYAFDKIPKLDNIEGPKFVTSHIVSPHPPYFFDENGKELINNSIRMNNEWNNKNQYLGQIRFLNKKMEVLIDDLLNKSKNTVIIIQSDHGSSFLSGDWKKPKPKFIKERSLIINNIYINNSDYKNYYNNISSVNTFRVLFNDLFNDNLEILKDITYYSNYDKPFEFKNVTQTLDSIISID